MTLIHRLKRLRICGKVTSMSSQALQSSIVAGPTMLLGLVLAGCEGVDLPPAAVSCHFGAYRLPDGQILAIRHREAATLRYVFMDGRTAPLAPTAEPGRYAAAKNGESPALAIAFGDCGNPDSTLTIDGGPEVTARRVGFEETEVRFQSEGVELVGRLILPLGEQPVPIAVVLHGSEDYSGIYGYHWPHLFAASGVGAFVYDKRGTGRSGGEYTQDFDVLAADAIAAAREARALAGRRAGEIGYFGGSQGGWIAPLAAYHGGADFVVVAYGMAEGPLAEDREEVALELRTAGYGTEALAKARELTDATGVVVASGFEHGWTELDALKRQYRDEPWFERVRGEYSGQLLRWPGWLVRIFGPFYDKGTSWHYEPLDTLAAIDVPLLWVLAGDDREAPSETTLGLLRELQPDKPNLDIVVFPDADHGILIGERDASGALHHWRYAEGFHRLVIDWIRTREVHPTNRSMDIYSSGTHDLDGPGKPAG